MSGAGANTKLFNTLRQAQQLGHNVKQLMQSESSDQPLEYGKMFDQFIANIRPELKRYDGLDSPEQLKHLKPEESQALRQDIAKFAESIITIGQESPTLRNVLKLQFPTINFDSMYEAKNADEAMQRRKEMIEQMTRDAERQMQVLNMMRTLQSNEPEDLERTYAIRNEFVENVRKHYLHEAQENLRRTSDYFRKNTEEYVNAQLSSPRYDPLYRCGMALGALFDPKADLHFNPEVMKDYHNMLGDQFNADGKKPDGQHLDNIPVQQGPQQAAPVNIPQGPRPGTGGAG